MKIKIEYLILIVVIVAVSLYLILQNPDRTHYQLPTFPQISEKEISRLEISFSDKTIVLVKESNTWKISPPGYPADMDKVKTILNNIENLTLTALVSESKNYERYELNDAKKIVVKAFSGDTLIREFEVGKTASSYRHTFVKIKGDDRIYHARKNFRREFDQTIENLRDKIVLSFEKTEIQKIHIAKGKQSILLEQKEVPEEASSVKEPDKKDSPAPKTEMIWQTSKGRKCDQSKLDRLLTTLSKLSCEKYIDDGKKEDYTDPIYTLKLKGARDFTLSIFKKIDKDDKTIPAISSDNDYPFLLSSTTGDQIMINPDELLEKSEK